ncbi:Universal stress protein family [hydrothermal vent metagenome]|uniref:Universal stress protein family n=1 Tax=hydrothermal vent metagenome TaxID=652676 RepID=A0A3B1A0S2_9ZZZZ
MTTNIPNYQQIVVAVDFSESSKIVAARALDIAQKNGAEITLLHAVEYLSPLAFGDELVPSPDWLLVEEDLIKQGEKSLQTFATEMGLGDAALLVPSGSPSHEITTVATEKSADLIVVGTHGRRGLQRLLGSTANSVINHAACDVLTVRLPH